MRYPLPAVLTIMATALLSGAVHITELCRAGQRLNQQQRAQIGLRRKPGTKFYPAPSYAVYRDLLGKLDLGRMAEVFNIWLDEHQGILPRSLAMDGKTIVDELGQMVSLVDQQNGVPVAIRRVVTTTDGTPVSDFTRYWVTSLAQGVRSPAQLMKLAREYWSVENKNHWKRDAVWGEDKLRIKCPNAVRALTLLRCVLLAPLEFAGYPSLPAAFETMARDPRLAIALIQNQRLR